MERYSFSTYEDIGHRVEFDAPSPASAQAFFDAVLDGSLEPEDVLRASELHYGNSLGLVRHIRNGWYKSEVIDRGIADYSQGLEIVA